MILSVFDFDSTLVWSPLPETGKDQWSTFHNKPYPHVGWWSKTESLDLDVFDIKGIDSVIAEYKKRCDSQEHNVVLLTSRMYKLRPQIDAVLDKLGINKFETKRFAPHNGLDKGQVVEELWTALVEMGYEIEAIELWDDRDIEIDAYQRLKERLLMDDVKVVINRVLPDGVYVEV